MLVHLILNNVKWSYTKVERLKQYDPRIRDVYSKTLGYVHFSDQSFYQIVSMNENYILKQSIGVAPNEAANEVLLEGVDAFIHYQQFQFKLLWNVVE